MAREPLTLVAFSNQHCPSSSSHPIVGMGSDHPPAGSVCQSRGWRLRIEGSWDMCRCGRRRNSLLEKGARAGEWRDARDSVGDGLKAFVGPF
jgi:hypothetical protein